MKYLFNVVLVLLLFLSSACGSKKVVDKTTIHYVKPPKWVQNAGNNDGFSSVGITNRETSLRNAKKYARENAVENLRSNILVKLENLFIEECKDITDTHKKIGLIKRLNNNVRSVINTAYLMNITRLEEMWQSPDSGSLYIKIVADRKQIAAKIADTMETIKDKYKYDDDIISLISKIKYDMLYNNFRVSRKVKTGINAVDNNNINDNVGVKKNGIIVNNYVITNKDENDDFSNTSEEWTTQDDEIDKQIRDAIKASEDAEKQQKQNKITK